ncbi:MAG: 50S ribosomal protein L11 methyltransferase [Bacteroidales bacterium]|nr:50S ribosomal protein L11 methyltransferase [Bacteroidales bacterium]
MKYCEITLPVKNLDQADIEIFSAVLFSLGAESIVDHVTSLQAYVPEDSFTLDFREQLHELVHRYQMSYEWQWLEEKNWNAEWEKDFEPVQVEDICMVRAPFHPKIPSVKYDIIIEPKMSFGTGHHETTWLVLNQMSNVNFVGKKVLDMGSGTGVLAIFAVKLGAVHADAIDNDSWAYENCRENIDMNETPAVIPLLGDAGLLVDKKYDVVLANINRNTLIKDMPLYVGAMNPGASLLVSGFFLNDMSEVRKAAEANELKYIAHQIKNNWVVIEFQKSI